ncbi:MAG: hypothetical protein R6U87_08430 [Thiohalospira sp.]
MTVAPSPFNGTKIDLGVVVVLLPIVWLVVHRSFTEPDAQILAMGLFSVAAALWLVARVRRVARRASRGER